jgi:hypothetical protein
MGEISGQRPIGDHLTEVSRYPYFPVESPCLKCAQLQELKGEWKKMKFKIKCIEKNPEEIPGFFGIERSKAAFFKDPKSLLST